MDLRPEDQRKLEMLRSGLGTNHDETVPCFDLRPERTQTFTTQNTMKVSITEPNNTQKNPGREKKMNDVKTTKEIKEGLLNTPKNIKLAETFDKKFIWAIKHPKMYVAKNLLVWGLALTGLVTALTTGYQAIKSYNKKN